MKIRVFKKRLLAAIIDYIIIFPIAYTVCALLMTSVFKNTFDVQAASFTAITLLISPLLLIFQSVDLSAWIMLGIAFTVETLYYSLFELLPSKRTLGYKCAGIHLCFSEQKSAGRIIGRNILKVLSRYLFCIPFIVSAFSKNGSAIYDLASKILVEDDRTNDY